MSLYFKLIGYLVKILLSLDCFRQFKRSINMRKVSLKVVAFGIIMSSL